MIERSLSSVAEPVFQYVGGGVWVLFHNVAELFMQRHRRRRRFMCGIAAPWRDEVCEVGERMSRVGHANSCRSIYCVADARLGTPGRRERSVGVPQIQWARLSDRLIGASTRLNLDSRAQHVGRSAECSARGAVRCVPVQRCAAQRCGGGAQPAGLPHPTTPQSRGLASAPGDSLQEPMRQARVYAM